LAASPATRVEAPANAPRLSRHNAGFLPAWLATQAAILSRSIRALQS